MFQEKNIFTVEKKMILSFIFFALYLKRYTLMLNVNNLKF